MTINSKKILFLSAFIWTCVPKKASLQSVNRDAESNDVSLEWREFVATKGEKSVAIVLQDMTHFAPAEFYEKSVKLLTQILERSPKTLLLAEGIKCGEPKSEIFSIGDKDAFSEASFRFTEKPHESGFIQKKLEIDQIQLQKSGFLKKTTCELIKSAANRGDFNQAHENTAAKTGNVSQVSAWFPAIAQLTGENKLTVSYADVAKSDLSATSQVLLEIANSKDQNTETVFGKWLKSKAGLDIKSYAMDTVTVEERTQALLKNLLKRIQDQDFDTFVIPWGSLHFVGIETKLKSILNRVGWELRLEKTIPVKVVNCNIKSHNPEEKRRSLPICMNFAFLEQTEQAEQAKQMIAANVTTNAVLMPGPRSIIDLSLHGAITYTGASLVENCKVNAVFELPKSPHSVGKRYGPIKLKDVYLKSNDPVEIKMKEAWQFEEDLQDGSIRTQIFAKCGKSEPFLLSSSETMLVR